MAYLSNLWICNPNNAKLMEIVDENLSATIAVGVSPRAVCVDLNMVDVWVANMGSNTVSKINNGVRVKDIAVGKTPMGICVDETNVWVSNYSSGTVSKITNGFKVLDITVGVGPRGICVDKFGAVWVANYLSGTVSKIVNDVKVKDIVVGLNPYGICSDKYGNVWVTNSGANTVSKIVESERNMDISVGKMPYGICVDKSGHIWVANYMSDTVSKIVNNVKTLDIPVGDGPMSIAVDGDGVIYVTCYLSTTDSGVGVVSVIANDTKLKDIPVCNNPVAFGDFTGMQAYILFKSDSGGGSVGSVSYDDLDVNLQTLVSKIGNPTNISADIVSYHNAIYTTVEKALDELLYVTPVINSFTNNVGIAEMGSVVNNLTLAWTLNKAMTTQTLDNGIGSVAIGTTSRVLTSLGITSDTTWNLTVGDDENTTSKATTLKFQNKRYWGVSALAALGNADILALNSEFATNAVQSKVLNATGGKYLYFVVPSAFNLDTSKFKIGGLANSDWVKTTVQFKNASNYTTSYDVFMSTNIQTGSAISVDIVS